MTTTACVACGPQDASIDGYMCPDCVEWLAEIRTCDGCGAFLPCYRPEYEAPQYCDGCDWLPQRMSAALSQVRRTAAELTARGMTRQQKTGVLIEFGSGGGASVA